MSHPASAAERHSVPDSSPAASAPSKERTADGQLVSRRALLAATGVSAVGMASYALARRAQAPVFIAAGQHYSGPLEQTIRDGLLATGFKPASIKHKKVLLKPNLVEPTRDAPQLTTHPQMVQATAEVFRKWDAFVTVGEAPGHVRDTELAVVESGLWDVLKTEKIPFADLNYEECGWVTNHGGTSPLPGMYFPRTVLESDLIVSLPKLKTHHWVGLTVSMKNLYGTLPGIKYGWPKNVLHYAGIPQTVVDINASLPRTISVVDGILCMEGDGPILGTPKPMGLVIVGLQPLAVDATCARIMRLDPSRVSYLQLAQGLLGSLLERDIVQRGEPWERHADDFQILDVPALQQLRIRHAGGKIS